MDKGKEQTLDDIKNILKKTEREQRLLEGDEGRPHTTYSDEDAIKALEDWGASGDLPSKDIARINKKKH